MTPLLRVTDVPRMFSEGVQEDAPAVERRRRADASPGAASVAHAAGVLIKIAVRRGPRTLLRLAGSAIRSRVDRDESWPTGEKR